MYTLDLKASDGNEDSQLLWEFESQAGIYLLMRRIETCCTG